MAIGLGGKLFGVRGGVRVSTKGVGFGVGAGPLKATGGTNFNSSSNSSIDDGVDMGTLIAIVLAAAFFLVAGFGVVVSAIPLIATSMILLFPIRSKRSRILSLGAAALIFTVGMRFGWNYVHDSFYVRAVDSDTSGLFTTFVAVVITGWIIGSVCAAIFFLSAVFRGKHLYDQIYLRPE